MKNTFSISNSFFETYTAGFRFGFNGKEKDDELYGTGNAYDYGMRMYDARLGRFMSVDPLFEKFPLYSPYIFGGDNPLFFIDNNGKSPNPSINRSPGFVTKIRLTIALWVKKQFNKSADVSYKGNSFVNNRAIWAKTDRSATPPEMAVNTKANFNKPGGKNSAETTQTPPSHNGNNTGESFVNGWPYVTVTKDPSGNGNLVAKRIADYDPETKTAVYPGTSTGLNFDTKGNILTQDSKSILYPKLADLNKGDEVVSEATEATRKGPSAQGQGAQVYTGTETSGGANKTNTIKKEVD